MKKAFFPGLLLVFGLCAAVPSGAQEWLYTSEGAYLAWIDYRGKKEGVGQALFNEMVVNLSKDSRVTTNVKLTKGQIELINILMNRYNYSRGEIYYILFARGEYPFFAVVCECTSNTQYTYWVFRNDGKR